MFDYMEVNTSYSTGALGGMAPQPPFAPAARTAAAPDSFASSKALEQAVRNLPASRPDALAQARALAADPNYPSPEVLRQVSSLLADSLSRQSE
jgi:hypothetical protein